jgi:hypothetical protein
MGERSLRELGLTRCDALREIRKRRTQIKSCSIENDGAISRSPLPKLLLSRLSGEMRHLIKGTRMARKISMCVTALPDRSKRRSRLCGIFDAIMEARQRNAERDIRRLIGCSDGPLSDALERRITEHLMRNYATAIVKPSNAVSCDANREAA